MNYFCLIFKLHLTPESMGTTSPGQVAHTYFQVTSWNEIKQLNKRKSSIHSLLLAIVLWNWSGIHLYLPWIQCQCCSCDTPKNSKLNKRNKIRSNNILLGRVALWRAVFYCNITFFFLNTPQGTVFVLFGATVPHWECTI